MACCNRFPRKIPQSAVFIFLWGILLGNTAAFQNPRLTLSQGRRPETAPQNAHWAFQKPTNTPIPSVRDTSWIKNPIDAFILDRLEKAGLRPALPLFRPTLLRRVTLDLTGLPPTPEEVDDFLRDTRSDAYVRVVDRLLASPHYGERWAQHWLDV
ncbi:MAG TPA: DUF1549 domain-containing protein, partial [Gemmataceae bacterium]|nr:DUF1549 domain-containing protein [Gemmataceae bacterium]